MKNIKTEKKVEIVKNFFDLVEKCDIIYMSETICDRILPGIDCRRYEHGFTG